MAESFRILLVEDNPDDVEILCETVAEAGCDARVETVDRLADARGLLDKGGFDLVLLDLSLLDSQGMATLDRALAFESSVPIVVLTGLEDEALGAAAVQHGAQDYLVKGHLDPIGLVRCMRYSIERHRLLKAQRRLIEDLERSNTVKTYYAATMTHELRNTLFAIGGLAEMLTEKLAGQPADLSRLAASIRARTNDSLGVIQASLELTSSEVRRTEGAADEINLSELAAQIAREIQVPGRKTGLRVEWDVPETLPLVRTDQIKMSMVLRNLINNAVKFTDEGVVRVSARPREGAVLFVISDTGIGIPSEELGVLFEPFRQVHGPRSRSAGGMGLGLYIAGRLIEILGGRITVESEVGRGTRFTLTVPLVPSGAS